MEQMGTNLESIHCSLMLAQATIAVEVLEPAVAAASMEDVGGSNTMALVYLMVEG